MTSVIATALQKGGAGKTTTTAALGAELRRRGTSVLLIDLDPQANLTTALGVDPTNLDATVYEILLNGPPALAAACIATDYGDLWPSSITLAGAELALGGRIGRELLLRRAIAPVAERYDYILIDTPPSLGLFTANALVAADTILVPLQAHPFAFQALGQLEQTIALVQQLNPSLSLGGIVLTMTDRTTISSVIADAARSRYGETVFQATIPRAVRLTEAPAAGQPISVYAPDSAGALAYRDLAEEVMARWPAKMS